MNLPPQLLDIIACPKCKGPLVLTASRDALLCRHCALAYPVRDEIPVLLIDEATPLTDQP
ncbi:MAG: Trm112 family protein [Desulfuromonadales bacterium]|nr:Trm112 family protein [Desulfuromonadales bacterium]